VYFADYNEFNPGISVNMFFVKFLSQLLISLSLETYIPNAYNCKGERGKK